MPCFSNHVAEKVKKQQKDPKNVALSKSIWGEIKSPEKPLGIEDAVKLAKSQKKGALWHYGRGVTPLVIHSRIGVLNP